MNIIKIIDYKLLAKKINNLVGCRIKIIFKSERPSHTDIKFIDNNLLVYDDYSIEITNHGMYKLVGISGAEGISNDEIDLLNSSEEIENLEFGDDNYGFSLTDVRDIQFVREARPDELGALTFLGAENV